MVCKGEMREACGFAHSGGKDHSLLWYQLSLPSNRPPRQDSMAVILL